MFSHRLFSTLTALTLSSIALTSSAEIRRGDSVVLMGDSEAFLLSQEMPRLAAMSGVRFTAVAVAGSSVIQWSEKLDREWSLVRRARPDVLLVSLGANDACMGVRIITNEKPFLTRFLRRARVSRPREIWWVGPPKIGVERQSRTECTAHVAVPGLEAFISMISAVDGVTVLDSRQIKVDMWDDKLHCSRPQWFGDVRNGCKPWAEWIWSKASTK